jgi:capsular polysaccharide transport system permease protein
MPETKRAPQRTTDVVGLSYNLPENLEQTQKVATAIARGLRRASRQARTPSVIVKGSAGARSRKGDRAFRLGIIGSFIAFVFVPLIVASFYWGLIASDQYSTQIKFTIHAGEKSTLDSLGGKLGGGMLGGGAGSQDTEIVADFIRSRAMVDALQSSLNLREIYAYPEADYFSRFNPSKPVEDLEKYWRKRVDVKVESLSNILSVDVRAFKPEDSRNLGLKILELSEKLINDISMRARRDAVTQAKAELARAEEDLQAATAAMRDTRNTEGILDAGAAAESIEKIVSALKLELSKLEQDLASQGDAGQDSPQSRVLRSRANALKSQIANYDQQIASLEKASSGPSMADRMSTLSRKQIDLDLARQRYATAAIVYENARLDLETQHSYLAVSLKPSLAEKAMYPRRWWEWSIIVIPAMVGWVVIIAIAFLVRDHMAK